MRNKSIFFSTIFSLFIFLNLSVPLSFATTTPPEFPSCANPQGSIIANYSSGTHGVPGVVTTYQGVDTVYSVSENIVLQCLCTVDGEGIQTNWWKASSLTEEEIESFKSQGWNFIPDGSAWGLDPAYYLAKNVNYTCRSTGGGESSSSSSSSGVTTTSIGDVLGLAATGNIKIIYGLIFAGFLSLVFGYLLKEKRV
ncbi:hypothetical protein A2954_06945 [Candidatus Roizmanbacteria bacterium RIFCSPLOWO2_01_FULL_37_12]|uniref:Ig-like domain-containing protein n=1 Tax=Candidatus Roizmanbacteria bacterium RIFCSPLOWO2_01_FULL_37_12 TaxID=1802056 RepID=A0A1F7IE19_9BACT|nr:MAG: hypothetical protein A3D76_02250 [Candidatus Roizmanbacteria bacterium RIFCSPHIGHO2_02_FULL_37_9b]OGK41593.1 MAG: hypothetical protein A2954_06945 [Candidatus Roizmanbacteria bacterium RIFCSPLOWO2_01_FULL_37_12]